MELFKFMKSFLSLHSHIDDLRDEVFVSAELRKELEEVYLRSSSVSQLEIFLGKFIVTLDDYSDTFNYRKRTQQDYEVLYSDLQEITKAFNKIEKDLSSIEEECAINFIRKYIRLTIPHIISICNELDEEFKRKGFRDGYGIKRPDYNSTCVIL